VNAIQEAASVLLARGPGSPDLFVVRRSDRLRFFGGFIAFPGGKLHPEDHEVAVVAAAAGEAPSFPHLRLVVAARELFEETGVLLARRPDGSYPVPGPDLVRSRQRLLEETSTFPRELRELNLTLHAEDFRPVGSVTTPPFVATRFDTAFYAARLPPGQQAEVWPGELSEGEWTRPAALLARWRRGECLVSPPTVMALEALNGGPVDDAPRRLGPLMRSLAEGKLHPIYFAPDVQLIPLHTQSLPPSTHTNAYVMGTGPVYLFDPGTALAEEQARLFQILDELPARGRRLTAVVLTHHHPDHVGAAAACAERYRLPVWAHPWTAQALRGKVSITRTIEDGDRLDLGTAPDGSGPWSVHALHTPGHAPGHLAFYEPHYRLLLAGDMVSTLSSVVIAPPEGDIAVYLDSLQRLKALGCRLLLPAHGGASSRPAETIEECILHRVKREEQLLAALGPSPRSVRDLADELYRGVPLPLLRFAELQLLAGLQKLAHEGLARESGGGWTRAAHGGD
jgi:endoribonuclease LACTB2